jgi:hypothetical protein
MAAVKAKLGRWRRFLTAVGTGDEQRVAAVGAEPGVISIFYLAIGANHGRVEYHIIKY